MKLEAFDAAAKPKIIREVKAMVPNLTLIEVCVHVPLPRPFGALHTAVNAKRSADHASLSLPLTRTVLHLPTQQAKKFVESAPQTLKENVTKDDAEKIQKAIEAAGGKVELA